MTDWGWLAGAAALGGTLLTAWQAIKKLRVDDRASVVTALNELADAHREEIDRLRLQVDRLSRDLDAERTARKQEQEHHRTERIKDQEAHRNEMYRLYQEINALREQVRRQA